MAVLHIFCSNPAKKNIAWPRSKTYYYLHYAESHKIAIKYFPADTLLRQLSIDHYMNVQY